MTDRCRTNGHRHRKPHEQTQPHSSLANLPMLLWRKGFLLQDLIQGFQDLTSHKCSCFSVQTKEMTMMFAMHILPSPDAIAKWTIFADVVGCLLIPRRSRQQIFLGGDFSHPFQKSVFGVPMLCAMHLLFLPDLRSHPMNGHLNPLSLVHSTLGIIGSAAMTFLAPLMPCIQDRISCLGWQCA